MAGFADGELTVDQAVAAVGAPAHNDAEVAPAGWCCTGTGRVGCRGAPRPAGCRSVTLVHWEDGGATDTANLAPLCSSCHRLHHRGRLGIHGNADDPDGLTFTAHHGRPLTATPTISKPSGPPPDPTKRYVHPLGERLDRRMLTVSDPPHAPPASAA